MKALLVGASPEGEVALVASLSGACDLVIAVDGGADLCLAAGITPDLAVGDMDSVSSATLECLISAGVELHRLERAKDLSDLAAAAQLALDRGARDITATAVGGGRLDHLLCAVGTLCAIDGAHIVEPEYSAECVHGGPRDIRIEGGAVFSVIALDEKCVVSVSGARWPLDRFSLRPLSSLGLSNEVDEGSACVTVHSGHCLVIIPRV